ncbi:MAG: hypothetical protein WC641_05025 [Patescibacteria group bacterium]
MGRKMAAEIGWAVLEAVADGIENFELIVRKPNAVLSCGVDGVKAIEAINKRLRLKRAAARLVKKRLMGKRWEDGRLAYHLTETGKKLLAQKTPPPTLPEGFVTIVSFDVPEVFAKARQNFRRCLRALSFRRIHLSVWVSERDWSGILKRHIVAAGLSSWVKIFVSCEI